MESRASKLTTYFQTQVQSITPTLNNTERATASILTEEELKALQNVWIQLAIWKQTNSPS